MLHDALAAALRCAPDARPTERGILVLGATGRLGAALLDALLARRRFHPVQVVVNTGMQAVPRGLEPVDAASFETAAQVQHPDTPTGIAPAFPSAAGRGPDGAPATAVLLFDRSADRLGRDRVFHAPDPAALRPLAQALRARGVRRLLVLTPLHERTLPEGLRRGLADLDEQALTGLGFEHLLFVRPAVNGGTAGDGAPGLGARLARLLLAQLHWMVPVTQRALRQRDVADFMLALLSRLDDWPPGTRVATAEVLWAWVHPDGGEAVLEAWGRGDPIAERRAPRPW
jgi:hypothetical protein